MLNTETTRDGDAPLSPNWGEDDFAVQSSYIDASLTSAKNAGAALTGAATGMSGAALAPFHRAVMANAERLVPAN